MQWRRNFTRLWEDVTKCSIPTASLLSNYQDRTQCTLRGVGGLPDVNTENPDFQKYYMEFVNDLLGLGVRGFRYDTAKHIGVTSDPVDKGAGVRENDFWDVATGRKSVRQGVRCPRPSPKTPCLSTARYFQDKGCARNRICRPYGAVSPLLTAIY